MPPTEIERLPVMERWSNVFGALADIVELEDGWNGEAAIAPPLSVVRSVVRFTAKHYNDGNPPDRTVPTPAGGILMEWHEADSYREAEFTDGVTAEWMEIKNGRAPRHWEEAI